MLLYLCQKSSVFSLFIQRKWSKLIKIMKKFEYKIETNLGENNLNIYGLEGWELIAVSKIKTPQSEDTKFYFKREI